MREVRMTFGEHLEELRSRIILALVWLAISTIVCFSFGDTLMQWVQKPHESAVKAGYNVHNYAVLDEATERLRTIMAEPGAWDGLFPEVAREAVDALEASALETRIRPSVERLLQGFPGLTPEQRNVQAGNFVGVFRVAMASGSRGRDLARRVGPQSGYLGRVERLLANVTRVKAKYQPTRLQKLLGLGRDFVTITDAVQSFSNYLQTRHDELVTSYRGFQSVGDLEDHLAQVTSDPAQVEARVATLKTVEEVLGRMEESVEELLSEEKQKLLVLAYQESFMNYFKVCLIFGIFFSLPWILWEMWKFVGAGLHAHEQRFVLIFAPFSMVLFALGVFFGYFWMIPFVLEFLATWGAGFSEPNFTLAPFISILFTLTILLGLVFQTPLVMIFLNQIGVVEAKGFAAARKYTLLGAVIFSTMVTPPDPLSWSMMAGPIMLLYELGIRICRVLERRRASADPA